MAWRTGREGPRDECSRYRGLWPKEVFGTVVFTLGFGSRDGAATAARVLAADGYGPEQDGSQIQVRSACGSGAVTGVLQALAARAPDPVSGHDLMSTITLPARPSLAGRVTAVFADTADVAGRNLRTLFRTPQALIFATSSP